MPGNLYGPYGHVSSASRGRSSGGKRGGGAAAAPKIGADGLPEFEAGKLYLLRGSTLAALQKAIRTNKPRAVTNGGIAVRDEGENGQHISVSQNSAP